MGNKWKRKPQARRRTRKDGIIFNRIWRLLRGHRERRAPYRKAP